MTRIKVFKYPKVFNKFTIGFGMIMLLLGIISSIKFTNNEFNTAFPSGDWNAVFHVIQGIFFISLGVYNLRNRKYFIEWDEIHLKFLIPGNKKVETIKLSDIQTVEIKLFEIELHLSNRIQKLDLNGLDYDDLKKIKAKFENFLKVSEQPKTINNENQ